MKILSLEERMTLLEDPQWNSEKKRVECRCTLCGQMTEDYSLVHSMKCEVLYPPQRHPLHSKFE